MEDLIVELILWLVLLILTSYLFLLFYKKHQRNMQEIRDSGLMDRIYHGVINDLQLQYLEFVDSQITRLLFKAGNYDILVVRSLAEGGYFATADIVNSSKELVAKLTYFCEQQVLVDYKTGAVIVIDSAMVGLSEVIMAELSKQIRIILLEEE